MRYSAVIRDCEGPLRCTWERERWGESRAVTLLSLKPLQSERSNFQINSDQVAASELQSQNSDDDWDMQAECLPLTVEGSCLIFPTGLTDIFELVGQVRMTWFVSKEAFF